MIFVDGFPIDCAVSVEVSRESQITSHPVEVGGDITDHVHNDPIVVTMDCRISNTPMANVAALRTGVPAEEGRAKLLAIRAAREPVTVELADETFDLMVLQTLSEPRSAQTGDAMEFRATFKEIVFALNARATVPVLLPRSSKKRDLGAKPSDEKVAGASDQKRSSAAWDLIHGEDVSSDIVDDVLGAF